MKKIFLFLLITINSVIQAQESINSSGENLSNNSGTLNYTIGQIDYETITDANGSLSQGVQQPYEFFAVGTDNFPFFTLSAIVFPNPTTDKLQLKIENYDVDDLNIKMFDIQGKFIFQQKLVENNTLLDLKNIATGTYLLHISDQYLTLKTFKIIKN